MSRQLIFDASALIAAAKTTAQGRLLLDVDDRLLYIIANFGQKERSLQTVDCQDNRHTP